MWKKLSLLCLCVSCVAWAVLAQTDALTTLSSRINEELANLKQQMLTYQQELQSTTLSLQTRSKDLMLSQSELQRQQQLSTELSTSLDSINQKLNDSYSRIQTLQSQVAARNRILLVAGIFGAVCLALKVVGGILLIKHIAVPRFVDWLL